MLTVWILWRKDRDYFDRMQIFYEEFLLQPNLVAALQKKTSRLVTGS